MTINNRNVIELFKLKINEITCYAIRLEMVTRNACVWILLRLCRFRWQLFSAIDYRPSYDNPTTSFPSTRVLNRHVYDVALSNKPKSELTTRITTISKFVRFRLLTVTVQHQSTHHRAFPTVDYYTTTSRLLLTSTFIPGHGNTLVCGSSFGTYLKNSCRPLYHLTVYSGSDSRS